jgi:hypothetical protein
LAETSNDLRDNGGAEITCTKDNSFQSHLLIVRISHTELDQGMCVHRNDDDEKDEREFVYHLFICKGMVCCFGKDGKY